MDEGRKHSGIYFSVCGVRFWLCMVNEVDEVSGKWRKWRAREWVHTLEEKRELFEAFFFFFDQNWKHSLILHLWKGDYSFKGKRW